MHLIEVRLRDVGIASEVEDGSLCAFRPVPDKPTGTTYKMSSATHVLQRGGCFRHLYCIEHHNKAGQLVKFSVSLNDENKILLRQWHLDFSHGLHTHPVENGVPGDTHVPYPGSVSEMATEIVNAIKSEFEDRI